MIQKKDKERKEQRELEERVNSLHEKHRILGVAEKKKAYEENKIKRRNFLEKCNTHKEELENRHIRKINRILRDEHLSFEKIRIKSNSIARMKSYTSLKGIRDRITFANGLNEFMKKVNKIKSESIYQWSSQQRKKEYMAIKRQVMRKLNPQKAKKDPPDANSNST